MTDKPKHVLLGNEYRLQQAFEGHGAQWFTGEPIDSMVWINVHGYAKDSDGEEVSCGVWILTVPILKN